MSPKFSSTLVIIFLLTVCPDLAAKSQLAIAKEFRVISVNGNAYKLAQDQSHTLPLKASLIKLNSGHNKIAIAYNSIFKNQSGRFETIRSNIFIVSFYLPSDDQYRLLHLKQANLKAARKFSKNPIISIVNHQNQNIKANQFFPATQSVNLIHQATGQNIKIQKPIRLESNKKPITKQKNSESEKDVEAMLLLWWQQATPEQRQSFLNKIKSSD